MDSARRRAGPVAVPRWTSFCTASTKPPTCGPRLAGLHRARLPLQPLRRTSSISAREAGEATPYPDPTAGGYCSLVHFLGRLGQRPLRIPRQPHQRQARPVLERELCGTSPRSWGATRPGSRCPATCACIPASRGDSRNTMAIWNSVQITFGKTPHLDLPAIGWDTYGRGGRGYVQGRIRGQSQIYTEFEYRVSLSRDDLWGAVGFSAPPRRRIPRAGSSATPIPREAWACGSSSTRRPRRISPSTRRGAAPAASLLLRDAGSLLIRRTIRPR